VCACVYYILIPYRQDKNKKEEERLERNGKGFVRRVKLAVQREIKKDKGFMTNTTFPIITSQRKPHLIHHLQPNLPHHQVAVHLPLVMNNKRKNPV